MFNQKDIIRKIVRNQLLKCDVKNIQIEQREGLNNINIQIGANSKLTVKDLQRLLGYYCQEVDVEIT